MMIQTDGYLSDIGDVQFGMLDRDEPIGLTVDSPLFHRADSSERRNVDLHSAEPAVVEALIVVRVGLGFTVDVLRWIERKAKVDLHVAPNVARFDCRNSINRLVAHFAPRRLVTYPRDANFC